MTEIHEEVMKLAQPTGTQWEVANEVDNKQQTEIQLMLHYLAPWIEKTGGKETIGYWEERLPSIMMEKILMLLLLPLVHVHMHYLTTRDTSLFHLLGTDFGQGLRRWGYIFVVLFVTLLIIVLVAFITTLPACILIIANMQSQMGVAQGDAMGMPSYISWLTTIVFAAASFIQAYAMMAILFPAYYMSGAIENKENEKKNTIY
jgi:hypothetical protein